MQAAGALAEAHALGLIHRDIKPANVLFCERGGTPDTVKLVDFGLVKSLEPEDGPALTHTNAITGTPQYLAPESIINPSPSGAQALYDELVECARNSPWRVDEARIFWREFRKSREPPRERASAGASASPGAGPGHPSGSGQSTVRKRDGDDIGRLSGADRSGTQDALAGAMVCSVLVKRWSRERKALAILPLGIAYLAVSILSANAGIGALSQVLEPIEMTSSDLSAEPDSTVSLGGDLLP
jgi:serine/threonine protein kinase